MARFQVQSLSAKLVTITAIAALFFGSAGWAVAKPANRVSPLLWTSVKQFHFAWDGPRSDCKFDLEVVKGTTLADPDVENNSPRLRVSCSGHRPLVVDAAGGLAPVGIGVLGGPPPKDNLIPSPYLYMTKRLPGPTGAPALILAGYAFASDPGATKVLALERSGAPRVIFSRDEFLLESISDLDHDGKPDLIGLESMSEELGCETTYDPFSEFLFADRSRTRMRYSLRLSATYNRAHYVWAGPGPQEDLVVIQPKGMSPKLITQAKFESLRRCR